MIARPADPVKPVTAFSLLGLEYSEKYSSFLGII